MTPTPLLHRVTALQPGQEDVFDLPDGQASLLRSGDVWTVTVALRPDAHTAPWCRCEAYDSAPAAYGALVALGA